MNEHDLLRRICEAYRSILGDRLTGLYVHGSIAFGCFTWATGDIDFLAVVNAPLTLGEKEALIRILLDLTPAAPPKGFEMSVVLRTALTPFQYPTPFELHYSNDFLSAATADLTAFCRGMHGTDPDLAAHCTVMRSIGYPLWGDPVADVFGEVPRSAYADSILRDVENAREDVLRTPVYSILNLCRVLAAMAEGAVLSKRQGGQWGLVHLPERYAPLLEAALAAYDGAALPDMPLLPDFAADVLRRIRSLA